MTDQYNSLSKGNKRLVWFGYIVYLCWMLLFDGWRLLKHSLENPILRIPAVFILYWIIVFLVLWVIEGFDD